MIVRSKANAILSGLFPNGSSGGTYIGLSTTTPNENGGNFTEPTVGSTTGYKRAKVEVMGTPSDGQIQNTDIIFFPESLGDGWGTITHFGLFSAQTGGTPYFWGELTGSSVQIPAGYIPIFRADALIVGLDKDPLDV